MLVTSLSVVIYARGNPHEIAIQLRDCWRIVRLTGEAVLAVLTDPPDDSTGWFRANALLAVGSAGRILRASRDIAPPELDSVTQDLAAARARPDAYAERYITRFVRRHRVGQHRPGRYLHVA